MEDDDTPIYETLFTLQVNLCERFPALNPLMLRREKAREVFLLIRRYTDHATNETKNKSMQNGKQVTRKPAGDDWF